MKTSLKIFIILLFALFSTASFAQSQTNESAQVDYIKALEQIQSQSNGNVTISIPDDIAQEIFSQPKPQNKKGSGTAKRTVVYRIQVFSDGRNQSTLQSRAKARGNAIIAKLPKYRGQVYTFSRAPNWFTQVGNFKSQEEAASALVELKRAFPGFASEMRVVRSK